MPRRARLLPAGLPLHVVQRGHNRGACFFSQPDYRRYLELLADRSLRHGCHIHAFVLMTNHVHLLLTGQEATEPSRFMKEVSQEHAQFMNWKHRRTGSFWEGRFHSCPVDTERYLFACHRYIELNPVRAGLASHPSQYQWSSYRHNAGGGFPGFLQPHEAYLSLGNDEATRAQKYRDLFAQDMEPGLVDEIRDVTRAGNVLGPASLQEKLRGELGKRTGPLPMGRPRKPSVTERK